jgi:hypothetical protein
MRVTDKNYRIEDRFVQKVDLFIKRREKNWDHLLLYDGEEGVGKSTCAIHHAYYIAHKLGFTFTHKNIFFDPNEMMKFAAETEGQVIMWDEAAFGAMGAQWQNQIQQKLIMCLMTARKKRHTWLFLIPELHKLNFYFINRASAVIHVYTPDDITRGNYVYFGKLSKKRWLMSQILNSAKKKMISFKKYDFRGSWSSCALIENLIDEKEYEAAKDKAIRDAFADDTSGNIWKTRALRNHEMLHKLAVRLKEETGVSIVQIAKFLNVSHSHLNRGKNLAQKHPDILGKGRFELEPERALIP